MRDNNIKFYNKLGLIELLKSEIVAMEKGVQLVSFHKPFNLELYKELAYCNEKVSLSVLQNRLKQCDKIKQCDNEVYRNMIKRLKNLIVRYNEYLLLVNDFPDDNEYTYTMDYYVLYYNNKHIELAHRALKKE